MPVCTCPHQDASERDHDRDCPIACTLRLNPDIVIRDLRAQLEYERQSKAEMLAICIRYANAGAAAHITAMIRAEATVLQREAAAYATDLARRIEAIDWTSDTKETP